MLREIFDTLSGLFSREVKIDESPEFPTPMSPMTLRKEEMAEFLSVEGTDDAATNIIVLRKGKRLLWSPLTDDGLLGLIEGLQNVARMRGL